MWVSQSSLRGWRKLDKRMDMKKETVAELVLQYTEGDNQVVLLP